MEPEDPVLLIDQLLAIFLFDKPMPSQRQETKKILSQTLVTKSEIHVTGKGKQKHLSARNNESGITAKLSLTNQSLQIYYPQPILFESSAAQKSKGSRLATDMKMHCMEDVVLFHTKLRNIASYTISVDQKSDNVCIICTDFSQCICSLSKWSAKSLQQSLTSLLCGGAGLAARAQPSMHRFSTEMHVIE